MLENLRSSTYHFLFASPTDSQVLDTRRGPLLENRWTPVSLPFPGNFSAGYFDFLRTMGTPLWEPLVIRFPFLITSQPTGYHLPWLEDRAAMSPRTAMRSAGHHFHLRFCRPRNRLFGMFENHGPRIIDNRVSTGWFDWEPQRANRIQN
jgi:hypothetical protein